MPADLSLQDAHTKIFVHYPHERWPMPQDLADRLGIALRRGTPKVHYEWDYEEGTYVTEDLSPTTCSRYVIDSMSLTQINEDNSTTRDVEIEFEQIAMKDLSLLPSGGRIEIKVRYGKNYWWTIPNIKISVDEISLGKEIFPYKYKGSTCVVNINTKTHEDTEIGATHQIKVTYAMRNFTETEDEESEDGEEHRGP